MVYVPTGGCGLGCELGCGVRWMSQMCFLEQYYYEANCAGDNEANRLALGECVGDCAGHCEGSMLQVM